LSGVRGVVFMSLFQHGGDFSEFWSVGNANNAAGCLEFLRRAVAACGQVIALYTQPLSVLFTSLQDALAALQQAYPHQCKQY
ncbi:hypothetical protein AIZ11_24940, partial [Salmonella enterica subsp. enterica serovar Typhimurium]